VRYFDRQHDVKQGRSFRVFRSRFAVLSLIALQIFGLACSELETPKPQPYYAGTTPPRKQEFRWSNGKAPKTIDPARAAAPPETDLIRAVFEGLTEIDPRTLKEKPAAAESWTSSDDFKTWTFHLRASARWSNGRPVTSTDFVRSWKRLGELGDALPQRDLLKNIVGFPLKKKETATPAASLTPDANREVAWPAPAPVANTTVTEQNSNTNSDIRQKTETFGVFAPDAQTLEVTLIAPDKDFPKLVAHPMFRPVFDDGNPLDKPGTSVVTNGAFRISSVDATGVTLERSETYWNRDAIKLERLVFVTTENAEQALAAYKAGDLDAVTNADFEPLALKLLEPFEDFRRRTHAAVNFYEINHEKAPFDDRRVREALAIAIERERLTEGDMDGLTQPALSFLPFSSNTDATLVQDKERARDLLDDAGFPGGKDFPAIKLVVNRNDTQQRVARSVARMWKQNLNIDTEVVVKENAEVEQSRTTGDFDLIRRGEVFPTADELMSILSILKPPKRTVEPVASPSGEGVEARDPKPEPRVADQAAAHPAVDSPDVTMSESNALYELWAIPLYFPTSYSLIKPYVSGFEMNSLDAPSLADVSIHSDWQPK